MVVFKPLTPNIIEFIVVVYLNITFSVLPAAHVRSSNHPRETIIISKGEEGRRGETRMYIE